jgi:hypothetical protein
MSRDSSVGIATGYGLGGPGSIPSSTGSSLLHGVQTESGAHSASYPMGTRGSFHGGKAGGARSLPLKKGGTIPPLPKYLNDKVLNYHN